MRFLIYCFILANHLFACLLGWVILRLGGFERRLVRLVNHFQADRLRAVDRANVGCASCYIPGWLNIGLFKWKRYPYGVLVRRRDGAYVLNLDMTAADPVVFEGKKYVYASHFIEHLRWGDALAFLKKVHAGMQKGGVLRLTCPDMELWIRKYSEKDWNFLGAYRTFHMKNKRPSDTRGNIFMTQCHDPDHRWNYDFESLKNLMEEAGFSRVTRKDHFESAIPEIRALEPDNEGRKMETMYVEGVKE